MKGILGQFLTPWENHLLSKMRRVPVRLTGDKEVEMAIRQAGNRRFHKPKGYSGAKLRELRASRGVGPVRRITGPIEGRFVKP